MKLPGNIDSLAPVYLRSLFVNQLRVVAQLALDKPVTRRVVALCGRRAGKTVMAGAALMWALQNAGFDEDVVYGARTRMVAKGLIWGKLKRIIDICGLTWKVNESELTITTDAGATLHVVGFDKAAEVEKLRGMKLRLFVADEPATYSPLLGTLFRDIVDPALGDVRGSVLLCGTPGPTPVGTWYEVSCGKSERWRLHRWTILDNPHFPSPAEYLAEVLEENGWTEETVTYQREYMARWVADDSVLVYRYVPSRNDVLAVPPTNIHTIGVDFGMNDETAWVVWGSAKHERATYGLHAHKQQGLLPEEAAQITAELCERYDPDVLVGDSGGLGKPYVEAFNRRYAEQLNRRMKPAEKTEKRAHIEIMNNDWRAPRLYLGPGMEAYSQELMHLPWHKDDRREEHPAYPNHCCDAGLYGYRHHTAYLSEAAPPKPPRLTPDDDEWIEREAEGFREESGRDWWDC